MRRMWWRKDDAENIKPSKLKSKEKIDDYCALLNAIAVSLAEEASPYSDGRGLLVIEGFLLTAAGVAITSSR